MRKSINDLKWLAVLMDSKFRLPGGFRIGLDGLIGLIPGIGDFATSIVSLYILGRGASLGCSPSVIGRMAINILIDNVLDVIPIIGPLIDFAWKSNLKNLALIEAYTLNPQPVKRASQALVVLIILGVLAVVATFIYLGVLATLFLYETLSANSASLSV